MYSLPVACSQAVSLALSVDLVGDGFVQSFCLGEPARNAGLNGRLPGLPAPQRLRCAQPLPWVAFAASRATLRTLRASARAARRLTTTLMAASMEP